MPSAITDFEKAKRLFEVSNFHKSAEICHQLALASPEENHGAWYLLAMNLQQLGDANAILYFRKAAELNPDNPEYIASLGFALRQAGLLEEADSWLRGALERGVQSASLYHAAGLVAKSRRNLDEAQKYLTTASELMPRDVIKLQNLGLLYYESSDFSKAIKCFTQAVSINPAYVVGWRSLAIVYDQTLQPAEAIDAYDRILAFNPKELSAWLGKAQGYKQLERYQDAIKCYDSILKIQPQHDTALLGKALIFRQMREYVRALELINESLKSNPENSMAWLQLGDLYAELRDIEQTIMAYQRCLGLAPDFKPAKAAYFRYARELSDWDRSLVNEEDVKKLALAPQSEYETPFVAIYQTQIIPMSRMERKRVSVKESEHIWKKHEALRASMKFSHQRDKQTTKLNVGYLSSDFRDHPVAHLTAAMFACHDRRRFNISVFSAGRDDESCYRETIRQGCDAFHDVYGQTDAEIAQLIHNNNIDILIDMGGHTAHAKRNVLALRPAPIQMHYLGFPGSVGSLLVDYFISDRTTTPKGYEEEFDEAIIFMPDSFLLGQQSDEVNTKRYCRRESGLPEKGLVLACLGLPYKVDPEIFALWMQILKEVDDCVLWLPAKYSETARSNLLRHAEHAGINSERLIFMEFEQEKANHLQRLKLADLCLDTRIYTGHSSCNDALVAGVPYLAIDGECFVSRVSATQMKIIGLDELVAGTLEEYHDIATGLLKSPEKLREYKKRIPRYVSNSTLFNTQQFIRNLERALHMAWYRWEHNLPAESFEV